MWRARRPGQASGAPASRTRSSYRARNLRRHVAHLLSCGNHGNGVPEIAVLRLDLQRCRESGRQASHVFDKGDSGDDGDALENRSGHSRIVVERSAGAGRGRAGLPGQLPAARDNARMTAPGRCGLALYTRQQEGL